MLHSSRSWLQASFLLRLALTASLTSCSGQKENSEVADEGYMPFPAEVAKAIKAACAEEVPRGIRSDKISKDECALFLAGASNRESSWDLKKSAEAWGKPSDPARGLTQSRDSDARYVGLEHCAGKLESDPVCNLRVGLRNLVIRADTLDAGVSVHLGAPNPGAKTSYLATIGRVWERQDVRSALGIGGETRPWPTVQWIKLRDSGTLGQ